MNRDNSRNVHAWVPSPKERFDVFLSYSHKDAELYGKDLIQTIKDEIEKALFSITCRPLVFLDSEALNYGDEWHAKIMEKLYECRVFICLLSDNYLASSYCTRERLWWERKEIQNGRLRKDTQPVYYIKLKEDRLFLSENSKVKELAGFQMDPKPWIDGMENVKAEYLQERIDKLKETVKIKLARAITVVDSFNNVFPGPTRIFTGRILELKELREICASGRYPVIEGDGGIGKTELAAVYSYGYAEDYPQGRFLIHMEHRNWQEAVVSLVLDHDTGASVRKELEISDDDLKEKTEALHRLIVEKLFNRAKDGRLLLVLDNVDDASLFTDRNLLNFSLNRPIPDNLCMIATTRHKLWFPNKNSRAQVFRLGGLDDDASFELFCEIGGNMFPFCRRPVLSLDSDPEYKAAMEIIHLLNGHVWSMEIIAGQVAEKYIDGLTFQKKLESLKNGIMFHGESFRNKASDPVELLTPTMALLKEGEAGPSVIQLAYFAALLPPDEKKKDILEACWKKYCSDVKFTDGDIEPFHFSFNQLWRRHLLQNANDSNKMHRLTQSALKEIMKKEGAFERSVQMLADVLVGTPGFTVDRWIELFISTHEIAEYLNDAHHAFFTHLLSPASWTRLLLSDHSFFIKVCPWETVKKCLRGRYWLELWEAGLVTDEECRWDMLDGRDWLAFLREHPQLADYCRWDTLNVPDWYELLRDQPQFAEKCDIWNSISGEEWVELLRKQPQFAEKCDKWNRLTGYMWAELLHDQPQFADRCDEWGSIRGKNLAMLLRKQPQFAEKCDKWDSLDVGDWSDLLQKQPQFIDKCAGTRNGEFWMEFQRAEGYLLCGTSRETGNTLESPCEPPGDQRPSDEQIREDEEELLRDQPPYEDRCPWDNLDGDEWVKLLHDQPQYADKCPWDKLDWKDWMKLLREMPQYADKCPWEELDGYILREILRKQPQFADKCDWDKLDGYDWANLLHEQPQFVEKCPWDKLKTRDWDWLLCISPQFAEKWKWDKLSKNDLKDLLREMPQYADKCPWDIFDREDWRKILCEMPQYADKCPWDKLTGEDWETILREQPQLAGKCDWNKLSWNEWSSLLHHQPQYADKCPWDKLTGEDWRELLYSEPRYIDKCPPDMLRGLEWGRILMQHPDSVELKDRCNWKELDGWEWKDLLLKHPQLADKCDWNKLDGWDWCQLLSVQPQYADKCPWNKLNGWNWTDFLRKRLPFMDEDMMDDPDKSRDRHRILRFFLQLADFCDWKRMGTGNWAQLLSAQPQFADKYKKWDLMSGADWAHLMRTQLQFADRCDKWDQMSGADWAHLMGAQPQFADRCDKWDRMSGADWAKLLRDQPQFADRCDKWDRMSGADWAKLLRDQPQFADRCDKWDRIGSDDLMHLLTDQPQFADKNIMWERLNGLEWAILLINQPQLSEKCDWSKMDYFDWQNLLYEQPKF